jgi:hypothetical protein
MTYKKVFRIFDYLVILLSIIMLVTADGWMERILWFNLLMYQARCIFTDLQLDLQEEINKKLIELLTIK